MVLLYLQIKMEGAADVAILVFVRMPLDWLISSRSTGRSRIFIKTPEGASRNSRFHDRNSLLHRRSLKRHRPRILNPIAPSTRQHNLRRCSQSLVPPKSLSLASLQPPHSKMRCHQRRRRLQLYPHNLTDPIQKSRYLNP